MYLNNYKILLYLLFTHQLTSINNETNKRILLAILDWGLGHASRCVPLIKKWQQEEKMVYVICSGASKRFLETECPDVHFLEWEGYAIRYPSSSMVLNMAWQGIRILKVIIKERLQMKKWVIDIQPDLIVSDGRFGCSHNKTKSVWMAHQLQIQHSFRPLAWLTNICYHRFIRKNYDEIWVPDLEKNQSLAGVLSRPITGMNHKYLGVLSRYNAVGGLKVVPVINKKYRWLALLSGPEPQRSILEKELLFLLEKSNQACLLVRGVTHLPPLSSKNSQVEIVDCLYGKELYAHVATADQLICRSGYSTLMDLYFWKKTAILIPTPGQTEQLYLAQYWQQKGWASWQEQGRIKLTN